MLNSLDTIQLQHQSQDCFFERLTKTLKIQFMFLNTLPRKGSPSWNELHLKSVFFNRGSASGCQGFRRNRPKFPGTKFATTVLCGCSNNTVSQVYYRK